MKTYRFRCLFIPLVVMLLGSISVLAQSGFDREAYYKAFANGEEDALDEQLGKVTVLTGNEKDAFEGALLMRKAGTEFSPAKKLSLFKKGGKKLEAAIKSNPQNVEYRFLRLMIQENAPRIVGYDDNIKEDSALVKSKLGSLSKATQNAVSNYAKNSRYL